MVDDSDACLSCMLPIVKESEAICCNGTCDKSIHVACAHITIALAKAIKESDNIGYICDVCVSHSMKTLNNKINGIYEYLYRIEAKCAANQTKSEDTDKIVTETNNLVKRLVNQYGTAGSTTTCTPSTSRNATKAVQRIDTSNLLVSKPPAEKQKAKQKQNKIAVDTPKPKTPKQQKSKSTNVITKPATTTKKSSATSNNNNRANSKPNSEKKQQKVTQTNNMMNINTSNEYEKTIVIKPKQTQTSDDTIRDMNRKLNPSETKFKSIRKRKMVM